jgi:hypothetical protein
MTADMYAVSIMQPATTSVRTQHAASTASDGPANPASAQPSPRSATGHAEERRWDIAELTRLQLRHAR